MNQIPNDGNPSNANILVVGRPGSGKTALIKMCVGSGLEPIRSEDFSTYTSDNFPYKLIESQKWFQSTDVTSFKKSLDMQDIGLIWYIIEASGARFTDYDIQAMHSNFGGRPVVAILTKCEIVGREELDALKAAIESAKVRTLVDVVETSADPLPALNVNPFGQQRLIEVSSRGFKQPRVEMSDSAYSSSKTNESEPILESIASIGASNLPDLSREDEEARNFIAICTAGAFGTGLLPLPPAQIGLLIPLHIFMVNQLGSIYGFTDSSVVIGSVTAGTLGRVIFTILQERLKNILLGPIGALLSGFSSATITSAIGFSVAALFHEMIRLKAEGKSHTINDVWMEQFLLERIRKILSGEYDDKID